MAYLSYFVYFTALVCMSVCVWLAVSAFAAPIEDMSSLAAGEGELVFVHVVSERFLFIL